MKASLRADWSVERWVEPMVDLTAVQWVERTDGKWAA